MHGQIHVTLFTTYLLINEKYNSVFYRLCAAHAEGNIKTANGRHN